MGSAADPPGDLIEQTDFGRCQGKFGNLVVRQRFSTVIERIQKIGLKLISRSAVGSFASQRCGSEFKILKKSSIRYCSAYDCILSMLDRQI